MEFSHVPVLFQETIDSLSVRPDGVYVCSGGSDKDGRPGGKRDDGAVRAKKLAVHGQKVCCIRDEDLVLWLHDVFVKNF